MTFSMEMQQALQLPSTSVAPKNILSSSSRLKNVENCQEKQDTRLIVI